MHWRTSRQWHPTVSKEDNMSESNSFGHGEFIERIAAYLSGGLEGADRSKFEDHREACASCAAELERAQEADSMLAEIFADAQPTGGFEDRIVKELRTIDRSMSLPHPMVLKVASGVAAAILLGAVGFVGNHLIQNNQLPGAAKVAQRDAAPAATQPLHEWLFDSDFDNTWREKGTKADKIAGEFRGVKEVPQDAQTKRPESEELGRRSTVDGTIVMGNIVNGEVEAVPQKAETAGDGRKRAGAIDAYSGFTTFADATDSSGSYALGLKFSETNQPTEYGFDGATTGKVLTANDTVNAGGAVAGDYIINGGTLNAGVDAGGGSGGRATGGGLGGQPVSSTINVGGGTLPFAPADTRGKEAAPVPAPHANRYYQPMALGSTMLGDAVDSEAKDLNKNIEDVTKVRDSDEKGKTDTRGILAGKPAERPSSNEYVTTFAKLNQEERTGVQAHDSTGIANPQQGQPGVQTPQPQPAVQQTPQPAMAQRKIIRNGEMEFEVDSFDTSFLQISKIVTEEGGFVSSTNSEKLNNGKVRGTVVVRVPPERLDTLVLKLRALGDLKSQKISAQDVTKVYYDLESELKAARAMEERLLNIIKSGKGEIKDLLAAEKELGVYRNKIEKFEGEIRYYNNLVSFSTLSITSVERDIRKAAFASQTEQVNMGIESEDVEKARADALKAIDDAKGRVIESNLKKFDAGQLAATITCEVAPDASGPLIDRLRQLGRVARLDIERKQTTNDGTPAAAPQGLRVEKKDTRFSISMYNLANIAPRQTTNMNVAVPSVEEAYRAIIETVRGKNGRIVTSSLNRQKPEQTTAAISFEVPAADADATLTEIRRDREVMMLTVTENPDTNNVTAAKRGFSLQVFSMATVAPRETETLVVASRIRVADAFRNVLNELRKADARILQSQINEQDKNNVAGILDFEVSRAKELDVRQALGAAGDLVSRAVNRSSDTDQTVDSKIRLQVRLISFDRLVPRETQNIEVASRDVASAYHALASAVNEVNGRVIRSELNVQEQNNVSGILEFELRREDREKFQKALEAAGTLFSRAVNRAADNINTVESKIRLQVHLTHIDQLPPRERTKMVVEVAEVDRATSSLIGTITAAGGRIIDTEQSKDSNGQIRSHIVADVPLGKAGDVRAQIRTLGTDRVNESSTNHQAPQGEVARARFDVTLANADLIVGRDEGLGAAVKSALSTSVRGLLWSLQFIVIGLLIVGPWALMIWVGWKLWRRPRATPATA
jgi:hypothetical protein